MNDVYRRWNEISPTNLTFFITTKSFTNVSVLDPDRSKRWSMQSFTRGQRKCIKNSHWGHPLVILMVSESLLRVAVIFLFKLIVASWPLLWILIHHIKSCVIEDFLDIHKDASQVFFFSQSSSYFLHTFCEAVSEDFPQWDMYFDTGVDYAVGFGLAIQTYHYRIWKCFFLNICGVVSVSCFHGSHQASRVYLVSSIKSYA